MEQRVTIDARFLVERQGRKFALFAGLLDAAHRDGLKSIDTQLLQIGAEENHQTWLFRAVVVTDKGTFSGHGDANPGNVNGAMLKVLPRMAETRSIARALRFAVNAEVAALEELDEEEADHPAPRLPAPVRPQPQLPTGIAPPVQPTPIQNGPRQMGADMLATPAQVRAIYSIARDQHNMSEGDVDERAQTLFGAPPVELTRKQASELITAFKAR